MLIEVKSFTSASQVEDLANSIGKYFLYSAILKNDDIDLKLYVAILEKVYEGIFSELLGQIMLAKLSIPIVVYNPESEVIARWIT